MMLARQPKTQVQAATKITAESTNKKGHTRSRLRVALHWKPEVIPVIQIVLLLGKNGL
jgi:hypothetical protein